MTKSTDRDSKVKLQVLVATIDQTEYTLHERMRIESDAIIANQADHCDTHAVIDENGHEIVYVTTTTRGVGVNRNIALNAADAEVCVFADDDIVYYSGYEEKLIDVFRRFPEADLVFFNLDAEEEFVKISDFSRVRWWNFLRYGTARVAIRLSAVRELGAEFDHRFGGGAEHRHGEDTLFFAKCLRGGLKLIAAPVTVGRLTNDRESTWSQGYDTTYVIDQGHLYRAMSPRLSWLWMAQDAIRRAKRDYGMTPIRAMSYMLRGK